MRFDYRLGKRRRDRAAAAIFGLAVVTWYVLASSAVAGQGDDDANAAGSVGTPNVVVILADDQGWGDVSLHGNPNFTTPNIDSIARQGATLTNFYVCPVCAPTRAEFLTGRYHPRGGVRGVTGGGERMDGDEVTIAELLRDSGFATAAYGKWHNGTQWPSHPNGQGFDDYYGFCSGHWGNYFSPMVEHNGRIVTGEGFLPDDLTDHAIEFIEGHRNQPFFVYLPLNTPHSPMQVPDEYYAPLADLDPVPDPAAENAKREDVAMTRAALAMVKNIDDNVGRLLQSLHDQSIADNTIVIYFSDNGPNSYRFNGGMRGRKGTVFEGGVRSPCFVRFPSRIEPSTRVAKVSGAVDLLPTLLDLTGVDAQPPRQLDGETFAPFLAESSEAKIDPQRALVTHWNGKISVRDQRFRYHEDGHLYDIERDPGENVDVAEQHPAVVDRLAAVIRDYINDTKPSRSKNVTRPFIVAYPGSTTTQLPARDAKTEGDAKHSNRHHNCTFIDDWSSTDDAIRWDVDVATAGPQRVEMFYAVDRDDVGSEIELTCGDAVLQKTIDVANEEELFGESDDRVPRIEGYVKRWEPMDLGVIDLPAGRNTLTLRATKVAGDEVAEMRLLVFHPTSEDR